MRTWPVLSAFLALMVVAAACTSLPAQVRPTDSTSFLGEWDGSWISTMGKGSSSGIITNVQIGPIDSNSRIPVNTTLTNAVVPAFSIRTQFVNGELIFESSTLDMVFRLHGDQLIAEYYNKRINDKGTWYLKRKG